MEGRNCRELIWRREELWVLCRGGSPDCRERKEKERERVKVHMGNFTRNTPKTINWKKERG